MQYFPKNIMHTKIGLIFGLSVCIILINEIHGAPLCHGRYKHHRDLGFCCEKATCGPFQEVQICKENWGQDTCIQCPPNSYMLDNTSSDFIHPCIHHKCNTETSKAVNQWARDIDPNACPQFCACDLTKGYCGSDPCSCKRSLSVQCKTGEKPNQLCQCVSSTTTTTTTSTSTTSETPSKKDWRTHFGTGRDVDTEPGSRGFTILERGFDTKEESSNSQPNNVVIIVIVVIGIGIVLAVVLVLRRRPVIQYVQQIRYRIQNTIIGGNDNTINHQEQPMIPAGENERR